MLRICMGAWISSMKSPSGMHDPRGSESTCPGPSRFSTVVNSLERDGLHQAFFALDTQDEEYCTQFQNQTDAILGHLNFPVRLWNMDPHSRIREKDTNYRNEMLPKTLGHLLQRSHYKWESGEQNQTSHWALWRSSHHCEETKSEMVWAQNKINRTCKDDPTGHCTRREKERQTEKEMGRQHNGVDRIKVGWSPSKGRKQRRMENSGCPIILGAPTVK